ncbi:hypothetical protein ACFWIN_05795 [Streptomyces sp. NPDC127049]|uniref:hypothetical protein n=1 Tax=Streptomyces sp. NPDC127049 TaxID=3347118 RepID=UPI00366966AF
MESPNPLLDLSQALTSVSTTYAFTRDRVLSLKDSDSEEIFAQGTRLFLASQQVNAKLVGLTRALATGPYAQVPESRRVLAELTATIAAASSGSALIASAVAGDPLNTIGLPSSPEIAQDMARVRQETGLSDVQGALEEAADRLHLAATSCAHAAFDVARAAGTTTAASRSALTTTPSVPAQPDVSVARSR